jgi:integrase
MKKKKLKTIFNPNSNHPLEGSQTKVEPIKELKDIKAIKKLLSENHRDLALFTIGINTNLRASDLLSLSVAQVKGLKPMDEIELKERKTGKARRISLNKSCVDVIQDLLAAEDYNDSDYLFKSQRGERLTVPSIHRLVKGWCREINLKGNYGSHTLRKTWGYHQRVTFGMGLPELMVCFNHSIQRQTLDYLCVQPEEIKNVYSNEL